MEHEKRPNSEFVLGIFELERTGDNTSPFISSNAPYNPRDPALLARMRALFADQILLIRRKVEWAEEFVRMNQMTQRLADGNSIASKSQK